MSGLLNRRPYPDVDMSDAFIVDQVSTPAGNALVLKQAAEDPKTGAPIPAGQALSRNPDGSGGHWEGRTIDQVGNYEVQQVNGALAVYRPTPPAPAFPLAQGFLYWPNVPNV